MINILKTLYDIIKLNDVTKSMPTVFITNEAFRSTDKKEYIYLSILDSSNISKHTVLSNRYKIDVYIYAQKENRCFDISQAFYTNILSENYSLEINEDTKINIKQNSMPHNVGKTNNGLYCFLIEYEIIL